MPTTYWARTDSGTANNPALNLTGDAAIEITFVPFGASGDIILEYSGGSFDPDTQVLINGVAYNFTFELSAALPTANRDGAQQVPERFKGSEVYLITVDGYPSAGETTRLTFLPNAAATQTEMDAFGNGAISLQNINTTTPGIICFASGTHILGPEGERLVEELKAGDLVTTMDNGPQSIVWVSSSERFWPGHSEKDLPIMIQAEALGPGYPHRNLIVSPQHKILVSLVSADGDTSRTDAFAPVKALTSLPGIRRMSGKRRITYHHVLFQRHEIIVSEGLASESFYPGPTALRMLLSQQRAEILSLFPRLTEGAIEGYGPTARRTLTVRQTSELSEIVKRDAASLRPEQSLMESNLSV